MRTPGIAVHHDLECSWPTPKWDTARESDSEKITLEVEEIEP